jgi:phosphocarrier protein
MSVAAKGFAKEAMITNELGMHARSAAQIAELAMQAHSKIMMIKGDKEADATSIMDMLTLECPKGTKIKLASQDSADLDILNKIIQLIENGFGE